MSNAPKFKLRAITREDQPFLLDLMLRIYPQTYDYLWKDQGVNYIRTTFGVANVLQELEAKAASYDFVVVNEVVVGILRIVDHAILKEQAEKPASKLHRIYLDQSVQGTGLGSALMEWVAERAMSMNKELLWLEVMDSQESAIKFYEKSGFFKAGRDKLTAALVYSKYSGMYRMWKSLKSS